MNIVLIILLIVSAVFFVWQLALFIRDLIKHLKAKKVKKLVNEKSPEETGRKEDE